jgi:hypothetical protein
VVLFSSTSLYNTNNSVTNIEWTLDPFEENIITETTSLVNLHSTETVVTSKFQKHHVIRLPLILFGSCLSSQLIQIDLETTQTYDLDELWSDLKLIMKGEVSVCNMISSTGNDKTVIQTKNSWLFYKKGGFNTNSSLEYIKTRYNRYLKLCDLDKSKIVISNTFLPSSDYNAQFYKFLSSVGVQNIDIDILTALNMVDWSSITLYNTQALLEEISSYQLQVYSLSNVFQNSSLQMFNDKNSTFFSYIMKVIDLAGILNAKIINYDDESTLHVNYVDVTKYNLLERASMSYYTFIRQLVKYQTFLQNKDLSISMHKPKELFDSYEVFSNVIETLNTSKIKTLIYQDDAKYIEPVQMIGTIFINSNADKSFHIDYLNNLNTKVTVYNSNKSTWKDIDNLYMYLIDLLTSLT